MKSLFLLLGLSIMLWACLSACQQQKTIPAPPCPNAGAFVKQATNLSGLVYYDSTRKSYGIQVPTSMDSADMGYTCSLPTDYQKKQLLVHFTGSYYEYDKPVPVPVGYKVYYLSLNYISK